MLAWRGGQQRLLQLSQKKRKTAGLAVETGGGSGGAASSGPAGAAWLQAGNTSKQRSDAAEQREAPPVVQSLALAAGAAPLPGAAPTTHQPGHGHRRKRMKRSLDLEALDMPDWGAGKSQDSATNGQGQASPMAKQVPPLLPPPLQQAALQSPMVHP